MRSSVPSLEIKPTACLVGNKIIIIPSNGARTSPSVGSIAAPLPITPAENAASLTCDSGITFPSRGLPIVSLFVFCLLNFLSGLGLSITSSSNPTR